jgi:hypothetical protein
MAYLLTRNRRIEEDLIDQLFNSSEPRLARMLLLPSQFGKEGALQIISPNVNQETLAEQIESSKRPSEDTFKALPYDCEGRIESRDLQVMSKLSLGGNLKRSVGTTGKIR